MGRRIIAFVSGTLLASAVTSVVLFARASEAREHEVDVMAGLQRQADQARRAQVSFKSQVQEWKNILLRGEDQALLARYEAAFFKSERATRDLAADLAAHTDVDEARQALGRLLEGHERLGRDYRAALAVFLAGQGKDFKAADRAVRGKDRPTSDGIDALIVVLEQDAAARLGAIRMKQHREPRVVFPLLALGLLSVFALNLVFARGLDRALRKLVAGMSAVIDWSGSAAGRLDEDAPGELGQCAERFNKLAANLLAFSDATGRAAVQLAASSEKLTASSDQIRAGGAETLARASQVEGAASAVTANVRTIAAGAGQLTVKAEGIARHAGEAARMATSAVDEVERTREAVTRLGAASSEIEHVLKVISSIAQRTNLLALNATIEAERAGPAGRGFAVVAKEVKELARRTAASTDEISHRMQALQDSAAAAAAAIGGIGATVVKVSALQDTIASAVEEQAATTKEIERNTAAAALAVQEIGSSISTVVLSAQETSRGAEEARGSAHATAGLSAELRDLLKRSSGGKPAPALQ